MPTVAAIACCAATASQPPWPTPLPLPPALPPVPLLPPNLLIDRSLGHLVVFEPPPTGAAIGAAVAATGNVAIVGAPGRTHTGLAEAGCAYVIDIDRARTRRVLVAPDAREYARLGGAVAITSEEGAGDDRYVLIGAPTDPIRPGESHGYGSVYVYAWRQAAGSDVFSLHAKLTPAVTSWSILRDGHFGCSIAVHAQRAAIGARGPNEYPAGEATPAHNGFVYLFDLPSGRQLARLSPLEVHTHEPLSRCFWFGASVALTEHLVVVSAPPSLSTMHCHRCIHTIGRALLPTMCAPATEDRTRCLCRRWALRRRARPARTQLSRAPSFSLSMSAHGLGRGRARSCSACR